MNTGPPMVRPSCSNFCGGRVWIGLVRLLKSVFAANPGRTWNSYTEPCNLFVPDIVIWFITPPMVWPNDESVSETLMLSSFTTPCGGLYATSPCHVVSGVPSSRTSLACAGVPPMLQLEAPLLSNGWIWDGCDVGTTPTASSTRVIGVRPLTG